MSVLFLVRHGLADHTGKRLYGTSPGVHLSEEGKRQAAAVAERLRQVPLAAVYSSPLERCVETAEPIAEVAGREIQIEEEVREVDYGEWTGRTFTSLRRLKLWRQVQVLPSGVRFPGGDSLQEVMTRSVEALTEIANRHGKGSVVVVTHGDVIRLSLAHFAGVHLDLFHRFEADTGSIAALRLGEGAPRLLRLNDTGSLAGLESRPTPRSPRR